MIRLYEKPRLIDEHTHARARMPPRPCRFLRSLRRTAPRCTTHRAHLAWLYAPHQRMAVCAVSPRARFANIAGTIVVSVSPSAPGLATATARCRWPVCVLASRDMEAPKYSDAFRYGPYFTLNFTD